MLTKTKHMIKNFFIILLVYLFNNAKIHIIFDITKLFPAFNILLTFAVGTPELNGPRAGGLLSHCKGTYKNQYMQTN